MRIQIIVLLFLLSYTVHAQKKLSGHVMITGSRNPVSSANVYLSTTSVGTTTNEKGAFTLQPFPEGRFDLVVSCIGYETYHVSVQSASLPDDLQIFLQPYVAELQEVVVENYDKEGWSKWGRIFLENFMGTSSFASDCELKNPDAIRLRLDKKRNTIRATASDQLIIENNALGYILKYDLTVFEYNLSTREFLYEGYPFFEEMQTDRKRREKRWESNRLTAYRGSLIHFMRSLYHNELQKQQFEVREWVTIPNEEKQRVREIYPAQSKKKAFKKTVIAGDNGNLLVTEDSDTATVINADTLAYYQSIMKQLGQKEVLINIVLDNENLAFDQDSIAVGMKYKPHVQVVYRPKKPPVEYQKYLPLFLRFSPVSSDIYRGADEPIFILPKGVYYDGINVITGGYWAWWEKMCNKLPYDYIPPKLQEKK
jgi:hypothetical protein